MPRRGIKGQSGNGQEEKDEVVKGKSEKEMDGDALDGGDGGEVKAKGKSTRATASKIVSMRPTTRSMTRRSTGSLELEDASEPTKKSTRKKGRRSSGDAATIGKGKGKGKGKKDEEPEEVAEQDDGQVEAMDVQGKEDDNRVGEDEVAKTKGKKSKKSIKGMNGKEIQKKGSGKATKKNKDEEEGEGEEEGPVAMALAGGKGRKQGKGHSKGKGREEEENEEEEQEDEEEGVAAPILSNADIAEVEEELVERVARGEKVDEDDEEEEVEREGEGDAKEEKRTAGSTKADDLASILELATRSLRKHLKGLDLFGGAKEAESETTTSSSQSHFVPPNASKEKRKQKAQLAAKTRLQRGQKLYSGFNQKRLYLQLEDSPAEAAKRKVMDENRKLKAEAAGGEEDEQEQEGEGAAAMVGINARVKGVRGATDPGKGITNLMKKSVLHSIENQRKAPSLDRRRDKSRKSQREARGSTAGKGWFDLGAPRMTKELKRELQLVRLRNYTDPKRHYKRLPRTLPKYFQVGTVVSGAGEYDKLSKRERKAGIVQEAMANKELRGYTKRKYLEIAEERRAGSKSFKQKQRQRHREKREATREKKRQRVVGEE